MGVSSTNFTLLGCLAIMVDVSRNCELCAFLGTDSRVEREKNLCARCDGIRRSLPWRLRDYVEVQMDPNSGFWFKTKGSRLRPSEIQKGLIVGTRKDDEEGELVLILRYYDAQYRSVISLELI